MFASTVSDIGGEGYFSPFGYFYLVFYFSIPCVAFTLPIHILCVHSVKIFFRIIIIFLFAFICELNWTYLRPELNIWVTHVVHIYMRCVVVVAVIKKYLYYINTDFIRYFCTIFSLHQHQEINRKKTAYIYLLVHL